MATDTSKEQRKPAKRRTSDGFVMMAMAVVTLALCMGLVAQVGLSFWLAVTVSAAFYLGLLTLHTLVRRHDQLDELRAEVDRLTNEVARLNQASGIAGRAAPYPGAGSPPASAAVARAAAAAPPAAGPTPAPGAIDPLARVAAAMPPKPQVRPGATRPDESATAAEGKAQDERPPLAGDADRHAGPAPQMQKIVRAPYAAGKKQPAADNGDGDAQPVVGAATAAPLPSSYSKVPAQIERSGRDDAAPSGAPSELRAAEASHQAPPATHKAVPPLAEVPVPAPVDAIAAGMSAPPRFAADAPSTAANAAFEGGTASDIPALEDGPPAGAPWTYRPGDAEREVAFSPSESDVEMIQGLIKKLADEVNSADAAKLAQATSREALDADALDRSVGALRQAARNMHEPVTSGRGRLQEPPPAPARSSQPAKRTEASKRGAEMEPPPPQHAAEAKTAAGPEAAGDAPSPHVSSANDLDVEALMRRAKPIASMTSMPPPLPAAPNIMDQRGKSVLKSTAGEAEPSPQDIAAPADDELWGVADEPGPGGDDPQAAKAEIEDRLARIAGAIEAGRVQVFLEPILDLEKNQARHYEVSVRLTDADGAEIAPDDPIETERPSGALPLLDSLRLKRTAHVAQRLEERNKQGNVFSTFSGQSLTSDDFLSTFAETYDTQVQLAGQLVLTFSQDDVRRFRNPHWTMVTEMRDLGFGFALRAVTDLDMDFEHLADAGFKFVKLDADVFLSGLPAPGALVPAADLCKHLEGLGLMPVVEALDDEAKREQVYSYGVRLGQGNLFGGARQIRTTSGSGEQTAAA